MAGIKTDFKTLKSLFREAHLKEQNFTQVLEHFYLLHLFQTYFL